MFTIGWNKTKFDTKIKLCLARVNLQKNKKTVGMKQMRGQIAEQLRNGQNENARIRVESVIRDAQLLQAYNILELYLDLFNVRSALIAKDKEIPRDLTEAVSSMIYAARRISDVPELAELGKMFAAKYGKEFASEAGADAPLCHKWAVNKNIIRCLLVEPPSGEEKLEALTSISNEYKVDWDSAGTARELLADGPPLGALVPPSPMNDPELTDLLPPMPAMPPVQAQPMPAQQPQPVIGGANWAQQKDPWLAAQAAAEAAQHAQRLAEHAASLAQQHGAQQHYAPVGTPQPPQQGWMQQQPVPSIPQQPPVQAAPVHVQAQQPSFPVKTEEEIQRAYDAAAGPPEKGALPPPSAPAPPAANPQQPAPVSAGNGQAPSAPAAVLSEPAEDELAALNRRLEALKRP